MEQFAGSNDFVRKKFAKYFRHLTVSLAAAEYMARGTDSRDRPVDFKTEKAPAREAEQDSNVKRLRELYDGLQAAKKAEVEAEAPKLEEPKKRVQPGPSEFEMIDWNGILPAYKEEEENKAPRPDKGRLTRQVLERYNFKWLKEWQFTINYRMWQLIHSPKLFCFSDAVGTFACCSSGGRFRRRMHGALRERRHLCGRNPPRPTLRFGDSLVLRW